MTPTVYVGYKPEVGGIGDFYYILFQVFCYCREHHINTSICIPNHPLNKCIYAIDTEPENINKQTIITTTNVNLFLTTEIEKMSRQNSNDLLIYTNMNDFLHVYVKFMNSTKKQVLLNEFRSTGFLSFQPIVEKRILEYTSVLNNNKDYIAIHIRCGDHFFRSTKNSTFDLRIDDVSEQAVTNIELRMQIAICFLKTRFPNTPICIFSDNEDLRKYFAELYNLIYFSTKVVHIADINTKDNSQPYIDSFCEFVMLGRAKAIFSFSVSNFSKVSSFLFGTPLYTFRYSPQSASVRKLSGNNVSYSSSTANDIILSFDL